MEQFQVREWRNVAHEHRIRQLLFKAIRIDTLEDAPGSFIHAPPVSFQEPDHVKDDLIRFLLQENESLCEFSLRKAGIRKITKDFSI